MFWWIESSGSHLVRSDRYYSFVSHSNIITWLNGLVFSKILHTMKQLAINIECWLCHFSILTVLNFQVMIKGTMIFMWVLEIVRPPMHKYLLEGAVKMGQVFSKRSPFSQWALYSGPDPAQGRLGWEIIDFLYKYKCTNICNVDTTCLYPIFW